MTRKITRAIANILARKQKTIFLGNLNAKRDWGFAPEYAEAMWLMAQQAEPDDYVIGTGKSYSVREFAEKAFYYAGIEIEWEGEGIQERGFIKGTDKRWKNDFRPGAVVIEVDPKYFRPTEVEHLRSDITKARKKLGWQPRTTFDELIKIMVDYDMQLMGLNPAGEGIEISKEKGFGYTNHDFSLYEKIREVC